MTSNSITSISDAIKIVQQNALTDIYSAAEEEEQMVQYPFPFAVWFRGHARETYELIPSVFRRPPSVTEGQDAWYDEAMMIQHVHLRDPSYSHNYGSPFDMLCLLQHHELPTRLLDWTESILIALYFAIMQHDEADGKVYALNARRLNRCGRLHDPDTAYICGSKSIDVLARSAMATAQTLKDLRYIFEQMPDLKTIEAINQRTPGYERTGINRFHRWLKWQLDSGQKEFDELMAVLRLPVAVFPNRMNPRMTSQLSMALIFGGKVYGRNRLPDENERLPPFDRENDLLETVDRHQKPEHKFLKEFIVPAEHKPRIRAELRRIGIHEASLFPELDAVGRFVRTEWTFTR